MAPRALSCTVTLMVVVGACLSQDPSLPPQVHGAVGENVSFTPISLPTRPYSDVKWYFINETSDRQIVRLRGDQTETAPDYEDRVSLERDSLALQLRSLTLNDAGGYRLTIEIGFDERHATTTLEVFEPVTDVTITPSHTELVEFNDTVSLNCSASGSSLSFSWFNGSSEVTAGEQFQLTDENKTLIITNVSRHDSGPYTCEASNVVSKNTSRPLTLIIYYGPDNAFVTAESGPIYCSGSVLTLHCSAESSPAAELHWAVNGTLLSEKGPVLNLTNIESSQSGRYTCIAYNVKSQRYFSSEPIDITILEKISAVKVTGHPDLPVEGNSTNLTCEASGTILSAEWMKDNQKLSSSSSIIFSSDNRTVSISPLSRADSGEYKCILSNPVSTDSASFTLTVNYGPDNLEIEGQTEVEEEQSVELFCRTESVPEPSYTWEINGTKTEETSAHFRVERASFTNSGNYTCTARNSVTGRDASGSHSLSVKVKGSLGGDGESLSAGAIAGIVIGVLLAVAAVAGLIVYFTKFKGRSNSSSRGAKQNGATQNGGENELHYADIRHQNKQRVASKDGSNTQTRQGTPGAVRAQRGASQNQGIAPASETVIYSELKK